MLLRRLKVYSFFAWTPVVGGALIPDCGVCFARMSLQHSKYGSQPAARPDAQPAMDGEVDFDDL